jgi:phosphosulfolactate phosphohydrolase-like enzyme
VKAVKKGTRKLVLNDSAHVALGLTQRYKHWLDAFTACEAGRQLEELALAEDVKFCAEADRFTIVPTYSERHIT